jgi:outer membrane protein OmpA-like peptidoglycan-associated protein
MGEPVNTGIWESQPALSADGEYLYFVSRRVGGKGKMDIWKARKTGISEDGFPQFDEVANVSELNTAGNDHSPFLHAGGKTIFFASDGRPGLGGSDLFTSTLEGNHFKAPVNMGYPLNTNKNEGGLVVELSGERAWFTSDRNKAKGRDILTFSLPDSLRPEPVSYLKGTIKDAKTGLQIKAEIVLADLTTGAVVRTISPAENEGDFLVCLPSGINYGLTISRKGYLFSSENIPLMDGFSKTKPKEIEVKLNSIVAGATTTLNNIFFETNSWKLKDESTTQLNEITKFMVNNPGIIIEVVGHTDGIGTAGYNLELSGKRAESVVQELVRRKIDPGRIKSRGAGFTVPVGDNATEEGRSANRRTEFVITKVDAGQ